MEEDNIISDDQLSTVEDVTEVMESDSHLTEEEQKVYEILKKQQEINAIAAVAIAIAIAAIATNTYLRLKQQVASQKIQVKKMRRKQL